MELLAREVEKIRQENPPQITILSSKITLKELRAHKEAKSINFDKVDTYKPLAIIQISIVS